jgi:predicted transcriptional regulator
MSNWGIEDDSNLAGNNENTGPKALRDAYEAMKKQNAELQSGLAAIQQDLQRQKIQGTLSELGIPTAAAEQYKGEADPEKVREWATTMQSIFGGGSGAPNTPNTSDTPPALEGDAAAQYQRMTEAGQSGTPLGNAEMAAGRIADATDLKGLLAAWQNLPS